MMKYLFVLFALTTLFSAQETTALVPINETDLGTVRRITGCRLHNQKVDVRWCIPNSSIYKFDDGKVTFHAYEGRPYRYKCENLSDTMKVTQRFFAITDKKDIQIIGLNILLVSTGVEYKLIAFCKSCIQWSELPRSVAYGLLESPKDWEKWFVAEHASSKLPLEVKEFCKTTFRFQF